MRRRSPSAANDISQLIANCDPECSTANVSGCLNAILGTDCADFQEIAALLPKSDLDEFCADVQKGVEYVQSPRAADDLSLFLDWYQRSFAPCVGQICSSSSNPVDGRRLSQAPTDLIKRVAEKEFGKTNLFFMKYGFIITIVLVGVIILLLFGLIVKR
jgi:hypothetical protein